MAGTHPAAKRDFSEVVDVLVLVKAVALRGARSFLQTFIAVLLASPVLDLSGPTLKAAAVSGFAAVLAMLHRLLDETSVPSLAEHPAIAKVGESAPAT
ncbi:MAG: hypothetical protein ACRDU8_01790 [Egibacteraceae bacterium]